MSSFWNSPAWTMAPRAKSCTKTPTQPTKKHLHLFPAQATTALLTLASITLLGSTLHCIQNRRSTTRWRKDLLRPWTWRL